MLSSRISHCLLALYIEQELYLSTAPLKLLKKSSYVENSMKKRE